MRSCLKSVFVLSSVVVVSGCAAEIDDGQGVYLEDVGEVAQRIATADDIAHACDHARNPDGGAYVNITATASASAAAPDVIDHEAYNITLPASGSSFVGNVDFTADDTAEFGIYSDPSVTVCVRQSNASGTGTIGNCLTQAFTTTISATTCPASSNPSLPTYGTSQALSRVRTYNLTNGVRYFVRLTRTGSNTMLGLFENLEEI